MQTRLYLDNAATSFPKPPGVAEAMRQYADELGASAGRGVYREAMETGALVADCRRRLARLINCPDEKQVIFTFNGTGALNQAVKGFLRPGDHVVTTVMEHNSVLRPLHALHHEGRISVTHVPADARTGLVEAREIIDAVRDETTLVAVVHASNVTGAIQPIADIGRLARQRGVTFLVDAAQTAGHVPIHVDELNVDLLAMPGHKGWLGPLGTGALYIRPGLEGRLRPLIEGGTGSVSERPVQPDFLPDRFESGSHNAIGIAGLRAALQWIEDRTVDAIRRHDQSLCERFIQAVADVDGLRLYGPRDAAQRVSVFSVRMNGLEPGELSALLESEMGILTRSGIHCAPMAHEALGTSGDGGTTRFSFGAFNTIADVDRAADALRQFASAGIES
jgi:cysteine desulfurase family protein